MCEFDESYGFEVEGTEVPKPVLVPDPNAPVVPVISITQTQPEAKGLDLEWVQNDLPGFTLEEALALSAAGLHGETDQSNTFLKEAALKKLMEWMIETGQTHLRAKRLLWMRRTHFNDGELANRVVEGKWSDEW